MRCIGLQLSLYSTVMQYVGALWITLETPGHASVYLGSRITKFGTVHFNVTITTNRLQSAVLK